MPNRHWLVALGALGVAGLLLTGPARAQYTTTQTTSLKIGETVDTGTTDGDPTIPAGYGLYAKGTTVDAPGNNTITTGGDAAHGIFLDASLPATMSTATGTIIHTTGQSASGV